MANWPGVSEVGNGPNCQLEENGEFGIWSSNEFGGFDESGHFWNGKWDQLLGRKLD